MGSCRLSALFCIPCIRAGSPNYSAMGPSTYLSIHPCISVPGALRLSPVSSLIPGASFRCPMVSPPASHRADIPNYSAVGPLTYHLAFALFHYIPHQHYTLHGEPLHPFHCIRAGSPNYLADKPISNISTLHFDARGIFLCCPTVSHFHLHLG